MSSNDLNLPIAHARDDFRFLAVVPGIPDNAAYRGHSAGHEDAVADGSNGRNLRIECVRENCTLRHESIEAAMVVGTETSQVVIAELIDDDADDQFGFRTTRCKRSTERAE